MGCAADEGELGKALPRRGQVHGRGREAMRVAEVHDCHWHQFIHISTLFILQ
jgi:hypothetical protein